MARHARTWNMQAVSGRVCENRSMNNRVSTDAEPKQIFGQENANAFILSSRKIDSRRGHVHTKPWDKGPVQDKPSCGITSFSGMSLLIDFFCCCCRCMALGYHSYFLMRSLMVLSNLYRFRWNVAFFFFSFFFGVIQRCRVKKWFTRVCLNRRCQSQRSWAKSAPTCHFMWPAKVNHVFIMVSHDPCENLYWNVKMSCV